MLDSLTWASIGFFAIAWFCGSVALGLFLGAAIRRHTADTPDDMPLDMPASPLDYEPAQPMDLVAETADQATVTTSDPGAAA